MDPPRSSRTRRKLWPLILIPAAASASLGPSSLSPFGVRKALLSGQRRGQHNNYSDDGRWRRDVIYSCRGGYADYVGDDDDGPWDDEQQQEGDGGAEQEPQQPQQPPQQRQQYPGQTNAYGQSPPPWQGYQQQQQNWENRGDEPSLPGGPSQYPPQQGGRGGMHGGPPQQRQHNPYSQQQPPQYPMHPGQQQQPRHPQQHSQYPPPPNLPGYGGPGASGAHPSGRVDHAHMRGMPPPGMAYEEDDSDNDEEGGVTLPTESSSSSGGGGTDLSQFDKDVIFNGLKRLYRKKIRPLELSSKYGHFHSPPLSPSDFDSKPMVLLLGQYSVGKTSFIRYLLGRDFPGQRIGPEPTTDRFVAILKGDSGDKIVPGAALCSQADRPFRGLSPFGNNFLSRFEGVEMDSPILNNITLVDTPGILSGQKQNIGRNYDYEQVMKWFAERADLIIIMFDAHKLDISDELKRVIELLKPHQDKMRVLLNKADAISTQQLMRVYGALMWSLGKVMMTPEVCRVYMGSFWGAPLKNKEQATLLTQEKRDLFNDIAQLPQNAVMRRINELVKRARSVKVHAYIIHYLRKQLPYTWGKREKQRRLIDRLDREFVMCARRYELPRGDFPELEPFRQALLEIKDLSEVHKLDKKMVKEMDKVFSVDIPNLLEQAKFH
ncbi:hypothetical protein ACHAXT_010880 [Thalassiosira profunda]